ncbi:hypothetical protein J6590_058353 [Homalodisca vitripennis]|nr:hypothetical protein J6590_058353 [Homalodisca vitripennis]
MRVGNMAAVTCRCGIETISVLCVTSPHSSVYRQQRRTAPRDLATPPLPHSLDSANLARSPASTSRFAEPLSILIHRRVESPREGTGHLGRDSCRSVLHGREGEVKARRGVRRKVKADSVFWLSYRVMVEERRGHYHPLSIAQPPRHAQQAHYPILISYHLNIEYSLLNAGWKCTTELCFVGRKTFEYHNFWWLPDNEGPLCVLLYHCFVAIEMIGAVNAAVKMATEEVQWIGPAPLPPAGKLQCYLPDKEGPLCVLLYHCFVTIEMIGAVNAAVKMATEEVQWIGPAPLPPAGKL